MAKFNAWEYADADHTAVSVVGGPTKNPKKMTGTRLGAICGLNKWKTPFQAWCEICRVAEEPFEDNKFTIAGKAIEPKLIAWCKTEISPYIYTPEQWFKTKNPGYDFFPENDIFGGMWDAIVLDGPLGKGTPVALVEAKTSSRPQDWLDGVPDSYAIQGLSYIELFGVDTVFFPVALLDPDDYDDPSAFECTDDNTILRELSVISPVAGKTIQEHMNYAEDWWAVHVSGNQSPAFNEKTDAVFLKIMRKSEVKSDDLEALAKEAAVLETKIEVIKSKGELADLEKRLKGLKDQLKRGMIPLFSDNDETVSAYGWKVKRTVTEKLDTEAIKADGLWETYATTEEMFRLSKESN